MRQITFHIIPVGKPRMVRSDTWSNRPAVAQYWAFKDEINLLAKKCHYQIGEKLDIVFYIPSPNSWSMKKRFAALGKPHQQKPDIDNLVKAFMDALTDDDAKVWSINAVKKWGLEGKIDVFEN